MKKVLSMLLMSVMILSLFSGCGGANSSSTETSSSSSSSSSSEASDSSSASNSSKLGTYYPSGTRLLPIYNVKTDQKIVALCFDADYGDEQTEAILSMLKKYNIPATFFLVGRWVDEFPDMVKKIAASGCDVMNHSNTHPDLTTLSYDQVVSEINTCNDKIENLIGKRPTLIRMPYGAYNDTVMKAVRDQGMDPIQWNIDTLDWDEKTTADQIYNKITTNITPGSIILCHNAGYHTVEAVPKAIEKLLSEGYKFVTVYDMIIKTDYTINGNGVQIAK